MMVFTATGRPPSEEDPCPLIETRANIYDGDVLSLANGTRGTVTRIETNTIFFRTDEGTDRELNRHAYKRVRMHQGKRVKHTRRQFPCTLAFARTIHSAQGSTIISTVDIDLVSIGFKDGQGVWQKVPGLVYTALSRARSLAQIRFRKKENGFILHPSSCAADPKVAAFYQRNTSRVPAWARNAVGRLTVA